MQLINKAKQAFANKPSAAALILMMAATRFEHFGSAFSLPDASLAVFFLAGILIGGRSLFIGLLLEAGLIDYLAITQAGVSDFCVSPAYVFLIPSYWVIWLAGKWCRQFTSLSVANLAKQFVALVLATTSSYLISGGSFYVLSGRIAELSWAQYIQGFSTYYPAYLNSTLIYTVLTFALVTLVKILSAEKAHKAV